MSMLTISTSPDYEPKQDNWIEGKIDKNTVTLTLPNGNISFKISRESSNSKCIHVLHYFENSTVWLDLSPKLFHKLQLIEKQQIQFRNAAKDITELVQNQLMLLYKEELIHKSKLHLVCNQRITYPEATQSYFEQLIPHSGDFKIVFFPLSDAFCLIYKKNGALIQTPVNFNKCNGKIAMHDNGNHLNFNTIDDFLTWVHNVVA